MANAYNGEIDIELYFKKYPMRVNMDVIAQFQTETGKDFMHVAIKSINAYNKSRSADSVFERAELMTKAVSMLDAAHLFYLAAKEKDSTVTFEEIQEAVLLDGPVEKMVLFEGNEKLVRSYPLAFAELVTFCTLGAVDSVKKS